jgi:RNA recognition motif-containing protein
VLFCDVFSGKVCVGNLGNTASKSDLHNAFDKYGHVKEIWVARNPPGFAFVEFEDPRGNYVRVVDVGVR